MCLCGVENFLCLCSGPKPAAPLSFTAQKLVLHILPCDPQCIYHAKNATALHGPCLKTQWILLAETSLQTSGSKWQHSTRDCTKVAFQRGKEKEAPHESAQPQCWASQAETFTFTPELEIKHEGTDWHHILHNCWVIKATIKTNLDQLCLFLTRFE